MKKTKSKKTKSKKKKVANLQAKITKSIPFNKISMSNRNKQIQNLVNYRDAKNRATKASK